MLEDHVDDSTGATGRQAAKRFVRHEEKVIVDGNPAQTVKVIARLAERLLREEGTPAFSPPLDPDGYKPWGVGPQPLAKPRQAYQAIPPEQVENIEISVYAPGWWDKEIAPNEPSPQKRTMETVGFLRFLDRPRNRTKITFVCHEVGWNNLRGRWEGLQKEFRTHSGATPKPTEKPRTHVLQRVCEAHRIMIKERVSKRDACNAAGTDTRTYDRYAEQGWIKEFCKS